MAVFIILFLIVMVFFGGVVALVAYGVSYGLSRFVFKHNPTVAWTIQSVLLLILTVSLFFGSLGSCSYGRSLNTKEMDEAWIGLITSEANGLFLEVSLV